jgi:hypothetical protein
VPKDSLLDRDQAVAKEGARRDLAAEEAQTTGGAKPPSNGAGGPDLQTVERLLAGGEG